MKASEIIAEVEELAPLSYALPDDATGLQCGDTATEVSRVMLALDGSEDTVRQAVRAGAQMLLTHHPLIFKPLTAVDCGNATGRAVSAALAAGLVVYSAHTNLDASPSGINAALADLMGLRETVPLMATGEERRMKMVVFVPAKSAHKVRQAAFAAGAGRIGAYARCSWSTSGEGTFFGGPQARPVVGRAGRLERTDELRLETVVDEAAVGQVLQAVRSAHPYEEPVVDIYRIAAETAGVGIGMVGRTESPVNVEENAGFLADALGAGAVRVVAGGRRKVSRVAVCGGSGASLLGAVAAAGARLYVTGDMKYHDARQAKELGVSVIDVGHFPAERYGFFRFGGLLKRKLEQRGQLPHFVRAREREPFTTVGRR